MVHTQRVKALKSVISLCQLNLAVHFECVIILTCSFVSSYVHVCRYYYCMRPYSNGSSPEVTFETGATYTIVLREDNGEGEVCCIIRTCMLD